MNIHTKIYDVADELLSLLRLVDTKWLFTTGELLGHIQAVQSQHPQLKVTTQHLAFFWSALCCITLFPI